jgi:hypothetical protein
MVPLGVAYDEIEVPIGGSSQNGKGKLTCCRHLKTLGDVRNLAGCGGTKVAPIMTVMISKDVQEAGAIDGEGWLPSADVVLLLPTRPVAHCA